MLEGILGWLSSLPPWLMYLALATVAAIENIFPPFPADTIVAFGAFLAARGDASLLGSFLATWIGNVGGAMLMYLGGRRFGPARLRERLHIETADGTAGRIARLYSRFGVPALFVSRFLPGARALVPPVAGAMQVPVVTTTLAIALASAVWYGTIAVLAYRLGASWDVLAERIATMNRTLGVAAVAIAVLVAGVVLWRRRRAR